MKEERRAWGRTSESSRPRAGIRLATPSSAFLALSLLVVGAIVSSNILESWARGYLRYLV
ncbi:predicted protein [Plenodomus lingam JN3]|uniref:Predicted protein n=1 Tax=Leptosphaeria maculans (strain JN3 / isolate v23.1.3 / race Av1-4-5-6-7-8) TaxID=985895 RepID=E5ADQ4_LEPMJ|nr:predicted protein [Plenodomus lingam JN3]CBY01343.1 predicted protein [Plenodomus lingam JN3]